MNGDTIRATVDYKALTNDASFWKAEMDVMQEAVKFIKEFKRMKPYDYFNIQPEVYDMKSTE